MKKKILCQKEEKEKFWTWNCEKYNAEENERTNRIVTKLKEYSLRSIIYNRIFSCCVQNILQPDRTTKVTLNWSIICDKLKLREAKILKNILEINHQRIREQELNSFARQQQEEATKRITFKNLSLKFVFDTHSSTLPRSSKKFQQNKVPEKLSFSSLKAKRKAQKGTRRWKWKTTIMLNKK